MTVNLSYQEVLSGDGEFVEVWCPFCEGWITAQQEERTSLTVEQQASAALAEHFDEKCEFIPYVLSIDDVTYFVGDGGEVYTTQSAICNVYDDEYYERVGKVALPVVIERAVAARDALMKKSRTVIEFIDLVRTLQPSEVENV